MNKNDQNIDFNKEAATEKHEKWLLETYGPLIGGKDLRFLLGYKSGTAFRTAMHRGTLPIKTFIEPGRRKRVARARDIALWLASIDEQIESENNEKFNNN